MCAKVLIVDDDASIRMLEKALLEELGHEVIEAFDGIDGEKRILLENPDMIILDLNMPGRRGEDILKFIKHHEPTKDVPVIVLSGERGFGKKFSVKWKGAATFIEKPFESDEFLETVQKYLG